MSTERDNDDDQLIQLAGTAAEAAGEVEDPSDGEAAYETAEEGEEVEDMEDMDFINATDTLPSPSAPPSSSSSSGSESDSDSDNNADHDSDDIDFDDNYNGADDDGRSEEEEEGVGVSIDDDDEEGSERINLPVPSFPPLLNSASVPVALGSGGDHTHTLYCGRRLGRDAIPGSDGRCGPDDGPQCAECRELEVGGVGRREVLRRAVPGLQVLLEDTMIQSSDNRDGQEDNGNEEDPEAKPAQAQVDAILTLALRQSGGLVSAALAYLKGRTSGALRAVDPLNLALPPLSSSADGSSDDNGVSDTDIQTLRETLGLDPLSARLALRRHSGDVQRAAAFALDEPEELGRSVVEEREREERREREREEAHARRQRALQEACSVAGGSVKCSLVGILCRLAREACKFDALESEAANEEKPAEEGTEVEGGEGERGRGARERRVFPVAQGLDADRTDGGAFAVAGHLMVRVPPLLSDLKRAGGSAIGVRTMPCGHSCELSFPRDRESCCECSDERPAPSDERGYPRIASRSTGTVYDTRHQHYCRPCRVRCENVRVAERAVRTCLVCAGSVPSPVCGLFLCTLCRMCEGCIQSRAPQEEDEDNDDRKGQAHRCPALRNGSHLHLHPLTYGLDRRRTCHCDIGSGPGGCRDVLWSCAECDFDVCAPCMSRSAPEGYDRLTGTTVRPGSDGGSGSDSDDDDASRDSDEEGNDSDGENSDNDDDDENEGPGSQRIGFRPLDPVSAERLAAARWEGNAVTDPPPGENVVGTGEAAHGGAFVATLTTATAQRRRGGDSDNNDEGWLAERREARRRLGGEAAGTSRTETRLGEDSEEALELLRSSGGGSGGCGGGNTGRRRRGHEEESAPRRSFLAAADLAHAEDLLHRARAVDGDALVRRELCRAVAGGRLDLVGSLLLSEAFAPVPPESNANATRGSDNSEGADNSHNTNAPQDECWCGLPINSSTSPDGSVGCLGGHNMHPSCASDLLLSGGSCPTCRMGLYYPRVPEAEAKVAAGLVEEELLRASRQRERGNCGSGDDGGADVGECGEGRERDFGNGNLAVDDFVRIEGCPKNCSAVMTIDPQSGGWCDDMAESCGKVGRVTEMLRDGDGSSGRIIAARVRTRNEEHTLERIRRNSDYQCKQCNMYGPSPETGRRKCSRCRLCERCCHRGARREDRYCPRARHEWTWAPALLRRAAAPDILILSSDGAGGSDAAVTALLDPEEAAARSAEGHVMRLRAELKAVAAAREGLRAKTEGMKLPRPIWSGGNDGAVGGIKASDSNNHSQCQPPLCVESVDALRHIWGKVSLADWAWARHLLSLAQCWEEFDGLEGDGRDSRCALSLLCEVVKRGDLDSAARAVRRRNVALTADKLHWQDATRSTAEYVVSPTARVELRARPSDLAPRTGYVLHPETRFGSRREVLDGRGDLWIQVDPKSFGSSSSSAGVTGGKVLADLSDQVASRALVGARVRRGPDWKWNDQDGGEGNEGVIVQVVRSGRVAVRWDVTKGGSSTPKQYEYRAGASASPASERSGGGGRKKKKYDLVFAGAAPQAPQGWLRVRPAGGGQGSPPVVWRSRSALRCFCCGDGLVPPRPERGYFSSARNADLGEGDELLVAATLEPVVVKAASDGRARCAFVVDNDFHLANPAADPSIGQDDCFDIWYRFEDLVFPGGKGEVWEEDTLKVKGQQRTRREVVLMCDGNEFAARQMWSDAKKKPMLGKSKSEDNDTLGFASCIRGHFLHARCLQGCLLAGRECPAIGCNEPLCVPRVKRLRSDDDTCCGADNASDNNEVEGEVELLRTVGDVIQHSRLPNGSRAEGDSSGMDNAGLPDLKMCPACCSGPLINQNCSDMKAHHGQCSRVAIRGSGGGETACTPDGAFRVTPVEIAEKIKHMSSTEAVTDILPQCPTHKVPVMFNGCLACGHLFTDTDWDEMPKWDAKAKSLLELDSKKRKAADLLAKQVRTEVALLEFERNQFGRFGAMCQVCTDGDLPLASTANLPPLPPPAVKYSRRGCGPSCDLQHFQDGECLVCGRNWGVHSGHTCPGGRTRGTWEVR